MMYVRNQLVRNWGNMCWSGTRFIKFVSKYTASSWLGYLVVLTDSVSDLYCDFSFPDKRKIVIFEVYNIMRVAQK